MLLRLSFIMKKYLLLVSLMINSWGFITPPVSAHPATGLVVDRFGNVYFIHTGVGVAKITPAGNLTYIYKAVDGHWMCLDERGDFSGSKPRYFERITPDGAIPAIIYAGGGSPVAVGMDGNFYYAGGQNGDLNPGAKSVIRETRGNKQTILCPHLEDTLNKLDDGITGIAGAPDSSLYLACWNSLIKVTMKGTVSVLFHPVSVTDCDEDPADHSKANLGKPLLRGIAVDSSGIVYSAATSCHCVIKITPDGRVQTILKSERPWSPTGVYARSGNIYVLEFTNANGPKTEGWLPRVRKIDRNGKITTLADLSNQRNFR